jgi:hypothetical protein
MIRLTPSLSNFVPRRSHHGNLSSSRGRQRSIVKVLQSYTHASPYRSCVQDMVGVEFDSTARPSQ